MGDADVVLPQWVHQEHTWPTPDAAAIIRLAQHAARGKRRSRDVATFLLDLEASCFSLTTELVKGRWFPGPARAFRIVDPKPRLISALPFRDRIVQHALIHKTLPTIERSFVAQSYACRTGFGTHRCLRKAVELARTHTWVLRIDMAKFFPSIDRTLLKTLLRPVTPAIWWGVTNRIIDAPAHVEPTSFYFPGDDLFTPFERPHGLPIGNLTSQIWANLFLSPVDHLLASHLGIGTFVRYCDDLLVFHDDKVRLQAAWDAVRDRCNTLRLKLHPKKCRLHRTTEAVSFLGFVLQRRADAVSVRLRQENVRRLRERMHVLKTLYEVGAVDAAEVTSHVRAWLAHASHGHTRTLCRNVLDELKFGGSASS